MTIISVGVSIRRKQDRNADGVAAEKPRRRRRCGKAERLQETKTGETADKVAETAHGRAMPCRAMTSLFSMTNDLHIQMIDDIIYFKMIFSYNFFSEEIP
jgi:hypothetical protein